MDIKAIEHEGELYLNAKDLTIAMKQHAMSNSPTLSVLHFVKMFTIELITARRD